MPRRLVPRSPAHQPAMRCESVHVQPTSSAHNAGAEPSKAGDAATARAEAEGEQQESEDEDANPDPAAAAASLAAAQQELTVLVDLIDSVAGQRAVSVQYVDRQKAKLEAWREVARVAEGAQRQLREGAARLRGAAATLRRQVQQDNEFVQELSELQARACSASSLLGRQCCCQCDQSGHSQRYSCGCAESQTKSGQM